MVDRNPHDGHAQPPIFRAWAAERLAHSTPGTDSSGYTSSVSTANGSIESSSTSGSIARSPWPGITPSRRAILSPVYHPDANAPVAELTPLPTAHRSERQALGAARFPYVASPNTGARSV